MIGAHEATIRRITVDHGGTVVKFLCERSMTCSASQSTRPPESQRLQALAKSWPHPPRGAWWVLSAGFGLANRESLPSKASPTPTRSWRSSGADEPRQDLISAPVPARIGCDVRGSSSDSG